MASYRGPESFWKNPGSSGSNTYKRREPTQTRDETFFPPWDAGYYKNRMHKKADIHPGEISEFFPLEQTAMAMLDIFSEYLQLRFDRLEPESLGSRTIWHEDVQVWAVWDTKEDSFLGHLYLDLLEREHKNQGYSNINLQCVSICFSARIGGPLRLTDAQNSGLPETGWISSASVNRPHVPFS